jgi:hypothetical protein
MVFLFEALPFELTFRILFEHGGFDALENVYGRDIVCWEFLKLMKNNQKTAELLCICRTVQLLDHPAHALFLLNYPPDSSIPENRRAWDIAIKCCIVWEPDVRSVVLAMRTFLPSATAQAFPWLDSVWLAAQRGSEEEWRRIGMQAAVCYKFNRWWWHSQKEAFFLEGSRDMETVIRSRARDEKARLFNALKRREVEAILREKGRRAWKKMMKEAEERKLRENNARLSGGGNTEENEKKKLIPVVLSEDRKREAVIAKAKGEGNAEAIVKEENEKKKLIPVILSEDRKKAAEIAKAKEAEHLLILKKVKRACIPGHVFQSKIETIAKFITCIERENPLIKWNLRWIFHATAQHTVWDMEFLLQSLQGETMEEGALAKMEQLWLKKK